MATGDPPSPPKAFAACSFPDLPTPFLRRSRPRRTMKPPTGGTGTGSAGTTAALRSRVTLGGFGSPGGRVPELDGGIAAGREDGAAIGCEGHPVDGVGVAAEG